MQPHLLAEAYVWRDEITYSLRMYDPEHRINGDIPAVKKIEGRQPGIVGDLPTDYGLVMILMVCSMLRLIANEDPGKKAALRDALERLLALDFGTDTITA